MLTSTPFLFGRRAFRIPSVALKSLLHVPNPSRIRYISSLTSTAQLFPKNHHDINLPFETYNFVNNELRTSGATKFYDVNDPATDSIVTRTPQSTEEELKAAVNAAKSAFLEWGQTSLLHRQQFMLRFVAVLRQNWDRLAAVITQEQGKTVSDARGDVLRGLQAAEQACGITTQIMGQVATVGKNMETRSYKIPLGVVASICPFNFPAMIPIWSITNAIITGNTLILKPSERTPTASLVLAELAAEAGLPPGVLNIVHGGPPTVDFILDHPDIKAISFIGGNKAGEYIYSRGSANGKRVQANLGAKNHGVLLADADESHALSAITGAAFGAAGQRCMALTTLVTVGSASNSLSAIVEHARSLKVDGGFEATADIGPVISRIAKERIENTIRSAEAEGAKIALDGRKYRPTNIAFKNGYFIGPTVITDVTPDMTCYREEIFGPVLIHMKPSLTPTLESAIDLINANPYGNGTAIFTTSGTSASIFQNGVEAGTVGINVPIPVPLPSFSFTGNKASIAGGGGKYFLGQAGLDFYTQTKTVTSLWRKPGAKTHSGTTGTDSQQDSGASMPVHS